MKLNFSLKGAAGVAEVSLDKATSKTVHELRDALERRHGIKDAEAERMIDDLLISGITRIGRKFEALKIKHVDTVVRLRTEIDGLYHDIFIGKEAGTQAGVKKALEGRAGKMKALYAELDKAIEEATLPLEDMKLAAELDEGALDVVKGVPAENLPHTDRPVEADLKREGRGKTRLGRKGFRAFEGGYRVRFADGAETVLRIEKGRYVAEIYTPPGVKGGQKTVIQEYSISIEPYKTVYKTTSVLQRNHVFQNSLMQKLFGNFGYNGDLVPTIWMRDSRAGSPHGRVTAGQRGFKTQSGTAIDAAEDAARNMFHKRVVKGNPPLAPSELNLGEIQKMGIAQMRAVGCPDEVIAQYMREFNRRFEKHVLPNLDARVENKTMTQAQLDSLLGAWKPGSGIPL